MTANNRYFAFVMFVSYATAATTGLKGAASVVYARPYNPSGHRSTLFKISTIHAGHTFGFKEEF